MVKKPTSTLACLTLGNSLLKSYQMAISPDLLDRNNRALLGNFNPPQRITPEIRQKTEDLRQEAIELLEDHGKPYFAFFDLSEEQRVALSAKAEQLAKKDELSVMRRIPGAGFFARLLSTNQIKTASRRAEDYNLALECIRSFPFKIIRVNTPEISIFIASVHPALATTAKLVVEHVLSVHSIDDHAKNVAQITSLDQCHIRLGSSKWVDSEAGYIALLAPEDYDNQAVPPTTLFPEDRALRRLKQAEAVIKMASSALRI